MIGVKRVRTASDNQPWVTGVDFVPRTLPLGQIAVPESPSVHLWHVDLASLWNSLTAALGDGASGDPGQAVSMTMAQLRFARRFYLRMLLGAYLGIPGKDVALNRSSRGKPVLDHSRYGQGLHFSLAKSGERVLIGIAGESEIGVDLEVGDRKPRNTSGLAKRFFTEREANAICALDEGERDAEFMRIWACKEAVAKASGHGIANRFCRFSVEATADARPWVAVDRDHSPERWQLALLIPEDGYLAAVAARQAALRLEGFRIPSG